MSNHPPRHRATQILLWMIVLAGFAGALWFANLFVFHRWAAYAPPEEAEIHLHEAKISLAISISLLAAACLSGWSILAIRKHNRQSDA